MQSNHNIKDQKLEESDFLYADLDDKNRGVDYERLLSKLTKLEKENESLIKDLEDSRAQISFLSEKKEILEKNITILFTTATEDIKRRDRQIIELSMKLRNR